MEEETRTTAGASAEGTLVLSGCGRPPPGLDAGLTGKSFESHEVHKSQVLHLLLVTDPCVGQVLQIFIEHLSVPGTVIGVEDIAEDKVPACKQLPFW